VGKVAEKKRFLVTGGAGFIGSALVRNLLADGAGEVLCVDKLTYAGNLDSLRLVAGDGNYHFRREDICNGKAMADALSAFRPDCIFHLAAESHVDRSIDGPQAFIGTNIVGTGVLLGAARDYLDGIDAAAREAFRFVHVSTDEVYGSADGADRFTEISPYRPNSPYSASKAASDHLALAWHRTYGLPVIVTNASNNYGPYQFPEKLIPLTIINALEGKPLPIYGSGENIRDWLHVDDHVRALRTLAERGVPGERYNVGALAEKRNIEMVRTLCEMMDERFPERAPHADLIAFVEDRPAHDTRYALDPGRLNTELSWRAAIDIEQGLRATINWYCENRWWWQPIREGCYSGERQGLGRTRGGGGLAT
jgi:dTDP-glucose 4,6-dehydratase